MSELRVLRCTRKTYSAVASYAGQNDLSLCEALTQIVNGTSGDQAAPWQFIKDHLEREREGNAEAEPAQEEI